MGLTQTSNLRVKEVQFKDTIQLDSLSIFPNSFEIHCGDKKLEPSEYKLNYGSATLIMSSQCSETLQVQYRVLPMNLSATYMKRDTSVIYSKEKGFQDQFLIRNFTTNSDVFGGSNLNKSGSISRGISFGNNQDLIDSFIKMEKSCPTSVY